MRPSGLFLAGLLLQASILARADNQNASSTGTCGLAVNASGHAVVTITNSCDAKLAATMQKLFDQGRDTNKIVHELRENQTRNEESEKRRFDELMRAFQAANERASSKDATPLDKQAAAALAQGDASLAIALFGDAAGMAEKRAKQLVQESDAERKKAAQLWRTQAALLRGKDVRLALAALEKALALVPDDFDTLWDAGDLAVEVGNTELAKAFYGRMLAQAQKQVAAMPNDADRARDLSVSHIKIGDMQSAQGDSAAALKSYLAGLAIRQKLAANDTGNVQAQDDLAVSYFKIGIMQIEQNDLAGALQRFQAAKAIFERLAALDSTNVRSQKRLAAIKQVIADIDKP